MTVLPRRHMLAGLALVPLLPRLAMANVRDPALAADLEKLDIQPDRIAWTDTIRLTAPLAADDGSAVPVGVSIAATQPVIQVHLFAPGNRRALLATISPQDRSPPLDFQLRIRLAKSQVVTAVARLADGSAIAAASEVRVTAGGGCKP